MERDRAGVMSAAAIVCAIGAAACCGGIAWGEAEAVEGDDALVQPMELPPLQIGLTMHTQPEPMTPEQVVNSVMRGDEASPATNLRGPSNRPQRFGERNQQWWSISSGVGFTSDDVDVVGQLSYHRFLADDFELGLVLGGWYHDQAENDAGSLSLSLQFRYHLINEDRWSIYGLAGAGMMGSTHNVPDGGTGFNFLPTLGIGGTLRLGDSNNRLDMGLRWHHISNANINGSDRNPDRDAPMIYVGIMFPF